MNDSADGLDWARRAPQLALLLGVFTQIAQLVVFREVMAACHGTEVLFGIILAGHLTWTASGSAAATLALRKGSAPSPGLLAALASAIGLLLFGEIVLARALAGWGTQVAGQVISVTRSAALAAIVTGPVAILSGAMFALALRTRPAGEFAKIYRAEAWGAVIGGLAFSFAIVYVAGPVRTALIGGALFAAAGSLLLRPLPRGVRLAAVATAIAYLAAACLPLELAVERMRWRNILGDYELVGYRDSPYGRICTLRRPGTEQDTIYHSGSPVATLEPETDQTDDMQLADLCATLHPRPRGALVIGRAIGAFPEQFFLRHSMHVSALELDPELFDATKWHPAARARSMMYRRMAADGRAFIAGSEPGAFDLIVVSGGEPDSATVNRFYTVEFFRHARRALAPSGVLVVVLPAYGASPEYLGDDLVRKTATISRAMAEVFGHVRAAPVCGILLAAAKAGTPPELDPQVLAARLAARPGAEGWIRVDAGGQTVKLRVEPPDYFAAIFSGVLAVRESLDGTRSQPYVEALEKALAEADAPTNRDGHPVAVAESLAFGATVAGADRHARDPHEGPSFGELLRVWGPRSPVICVVAASGISLALILLAVARRRRLGPRPGLLLCAFATGLFGMALTVVLLGAYQNVRGCVYSEIGGIAASFMVGLALGTQFGRSGGDGSRALLFGTVTAMIVLCLAAPSVVAALGPLRHTRLAAAGLWLLVLLAGLLDGATFPPLVLLGAAEGDERFGGWVYAMDLLGAGLGAVLCGAVWMPLVGIAVTLLAVAGVLAAAALALAAARM